MWVSQTATEATGLDEIPREEMQLEQQPRLSPGAFQHSELGRSGGTRKDQLVRLRAKREYVLEDK